MKAKTEVYHLFHSGIAVKTANNLLIFDYYRDKTPHKHRSLETGVVSKELLQTEENIFVFATHSHHDHFNAKILDWEKENENIKYILSSDIEVGDNDNYYSIDKYQKLKLDDLVIETFGTTDQGLSFYVEVDGINLFHSGDLNWWHWKKFSADERKIEERDFKKEVEEFKNKEIDIAFVPVDYRLKEYYYLAGKYFIKTVHPNLLVPIHFSTKYYITEDFKEKVSDLDVNAAVITKRGEKIVYNN